MALVPFEAGRPPTEAPRVGKVLIQASMLRRRTPLKEDCQVLRTTAGENVAAGRYRRSSVPHVDRRADTHRPSLLPGARNPPDLGRQRGRLSGSTTLVLHLVHACPQHVAAPLPQQPFPTPRGSAHRAGTCRPWAPCLQRPTQSTRSPVAPPGQIDPVGRPCWLGLQPVHVHPPRGALPHDSQRAAVPWRRKRRAPSH